MTTPADLEIVRRRVKFSFDPEAAAGWTRMSRSGEDVLNAISFLFPLGEAFFVRSVAHYLDRITDPVLKAQAQDFIHQEAMHSREHARSNKALREANAFGAELERMAAINLGLARRLLPRSTQLAVTCALEHFTAVLAEQLLRHRRLDQDGTDPDFAALWMWHAAEEVEHKGVCFDVFQHVVGRGVFAWLHRVLGMVLVTLFGGVGLAVTFAIVRLKLARQRRARPAGAAAEAASGGPSFASLFETVELRSYLAYYKRSFHPWDQDDRPLLDAWRRENPNFGTH
jgi:predicted metal-dependent hydrolase